MSEELGQIKSDLGALERAYQDAGGQLAADRDHCPCPFCHDKTGFSIRVGRKSGKPQWQCHSKCGMSKAGSIVDLVMQSQGIDSKAACKVVLEKYGRGQRAEARGQSEQKRDASQAMDRSKPPGVVIAADTALVGVPTSGTQHDAVGTPAPQEKKKKKLHQTPDLACDAVLWSMQQKKDPKAEFVKRWNYTDAAGLPVFTVARFKMSNGNKEIVPIHRDGIGWRVGLGEWGSEGQLMPMYRLKEMTKALGANALVGVPTSGTQKGGVDAAN